MGDFMPQVSAFFELITSCESCMQREFVFLCEDTFVCDGCMP
jgi:hypothetical protein